MPTQPVDVTIIVPTFNRAHYLGECLSALLGQSVPARQVIVVDDGSTDHTASVVAGFGGRVAYHRQPNRGKAAALNLGLGHATGAAIWIFDDDDIAEPDALERLYEALAAAPRAAFAFGHFDNFSDAADGTRQFMQVADPIFDGADLTAAVLERCFMFQAAMLVRRSAYDATGPFDTGFIRAQDYEMLTRLVRHAPGVRVPGIVFHQRQHLERRGTAAHAIEGAEVWERQKAFDAQVLDKVHRTFPLAAYLPRPEPGADLTPVETVRALLRRAAVTARKRLWDLAGADIAAAAGFAARHGITRIEPAEVAILGRIFDETSYARDDLDADNPLLRQVRALPLGRFRTALSASLAWPIFRYVLLATRRGDGSEAMRYARLYRSVGSARVLTQHSARLLGKAVAPAARDA